MVGWTSFGEAEPVSDQGGLQIRELIPHEFWFAPEPSSSRFIQKKKYLLRRELTDGDSIRLQIMSEPGGGGERKNDFGLHHWQDGGIET